MCGWLIELEAVWSCLLLGWILFKGSVYYGMAFEWPYIYWGLCIGGELVLVMTNFKEKSLQAKKFVALNLYIL